MIRLVLFLIGVLAAAMGFSWLADNPGSITVDWLGYRAEPTVFQAVVVLLFGLAVLLLLWSVLRQLWTSPYLLGRFLAKRRQRRGLDALSSGMIAVGAGDRANATRYALLARKSLPNEPLTHLLRAQAAQLAGDRATARRIYEAMLSSPDTEPLGLRGLYLEAQREREAEAERQFAERAHRLNVRLSWPMEAMFQLACKEGRWDDALTTLSAQRKHGNLEKAVYDRRRAVLLTARAQELEEASADKALSLASEAHALAPDLIPAAAIAARIHASRGAIGKAARVIQKTWVKAPHPDLATAYAFARIGDSPRDRLDRVRQLVALDARSPESSIALAQAAIDARQFDVARGALSPWLGEGLTRRVALLMARVESEDGGDKGRAREWLARAAQAGRDPAWVADGVVSDHWLPVSTATGQLDAFRWCVPAEEWESREIESLAAQFLALGGEEGAPVLDMESGAGETGVPASVELAAAAPASLHGAPSEVVVEAEEVTALDVTETAGAIAGPEPAPAVADVAEAAPEPPQANGGGQSARTRGRGTTRTMTAGKPKKATPTFVAPPIPDDPGAGPEEDDLPRGANPYRSKA